MAEAINLGVRKINLGSILKKSYFDGLRNACVRIGADYNLAMRCSAPERRILPGQWRASAAKDRRAFYGDLSQRREGLSRDALLPPRKY